MKKKKDPLVSVIVNCHNGSLYLKDCLKSILIQSYSNLELIFWDNKSTDNSYDIVKKFKDRRIKKFRSRSFQALYKSRNLAIKKSKGKYISFLDTDDIWQKDKLKKQISFLENNQDYGLVYSNYYFKYQNKNKEVLSYKDSLPSGHILNALLKRYYVGILTVCIRRKIFKDYSFNEKYNIIGDFDFIIRLSRKIKIGSIQKPLAYYRVHDGNFSKKINIHIKELVEWTKVYNGKLELFHVKVLIFKLKIKKFFNFILDR